MRRLFSRLFGPSEATTLARETALEEGRRTLQYRYARFREALEANTRALSGMTELEHALHVADPPAPDLLAWLDAMVVRIGRDVFAMIIALQDMAPGRYKGLRTRFKAIHQDINASLRTRPVSAQGPFTLRLSQCDKSMGAMVGDNMAQLGEVRGQLLFAVPPGFAITVHGFALFRDATSLDRLVAANAPDLDPSRPQALHAACARIRRHIVDATLPDELEVEIWKQFARLEDVKGARLAVAVRSSAIGEDAPGASFAGQFRTILNVRRDDLIPSIKEVLASLWSPAAVTYRKRLGLRETEAVMSVGVLAQEEAVCGGVAYSRHPLAPGLDVVAVASNWGLPKSVVDGSTPTDHFLVSRFAPFRVVESQIVEKSRKFVCSVEEGVCRLEVNAVDALRPSLDESQIFKVAHAVLRLEEYFGHPVDVEWCIGPANQVVILQCRPLEVDAEGDASPVHVPPAIPPLAAGGMGASPGSACGPAFVLRNDADSLRVSQGDVLVVETASPRHAALLPRVAAVVAEHGSLTGHLANVARELGVPAIFGLKGARDHAPPGKLITVSADLGMIFPGKVHALLAQRQRRAAPRDTPGRRAMRRVHERIEPLTMLDPQAPDFMAANCQTWHDITRFCHEKVVTELFQQAESLDKRMAEDDMASCRRLVAESTMQFWVLDLGGGALPPEEDVEIVEDVYMGRKLSHKIVNVKKYVKLDEIVSQPMLAVWRGMMIKPWAGPPAMDAKGLMSVMFEAATNPHLDPSQASPMQNKNYFIISRDFVCVQLRFGFHFATVEALLDPDPSNAYVLFRFRGGAADLQRRSTRAAMVGSLLAEHGFTIEIKGDQLNAKADCLPPEIILKQLEVLGYLLMHTRQLDMIMADAGKVARHRRQLQTDIKALFSGLPLPD